MFNSLPLGATDVVMRAQLVTHDDHEAERRGEPRRILRLATRASQRGEGVDVDVLNVSHNGLLIRTSSALALDEAITVILPDQAECLASIAWGAEGLYGCRFEESLTKAEMSAVVMRSEPDRQDTVTSTVEDVAGELSGESFGSRLRQARLRIGRSMVDLARDVGVSKPTLWKWETDRVRPRQGSLRKLSELVGVDELVLLYGGGGRGKQVAAAGGGHAPAVTLADMIGEFRTEISLAAGVERERVAIDIDWA